MKKVGFRGKPPSGSPPQVDAWVADREQLPLPAEPTRRFTFDVPVPLHRRIKAACVQQDRNMADVIRELLETHFPESPG